MNQSPYQILDIAPGANWEQIRKTYKNQALKWHPDKPTPQGFTKDQQEEKFKEINNAFEQITKEKTGNDEEEISGFDLNPQDIIDEIFAEIGLDNFEDFENRFLDFSKRITIDNIKIWMMGIENEIDADPNFWNQFGRDWEEKIKQMDDNDKIGSFREEMFQALRKINEEQFAKEKAKADEFVENSDKGLQLIKNYLRIKNLSNNDFNNYLLKTCPDLIKGRNNWYENNTSWGHKDSINTYIQIIDGCADQKQILLDEKRQNWKSKQGGDNHSRSLSITEINNYWGSEKTINGKKLEEIIGTDWRTQINSSKGTDINKKKDHFKKMIDLAKQNNQDSSPREYLPYILGGIGVFAFITLIIVLATNNSRRRR